MREKELLTLDKLVCDNMPRTGSLFQPIAKDLQSLPQKLQNHGTWNLDWFSCTGVFKEGRYGDRPWSFDVFYIGLQSAPGAQQSSVFTCCFSRYLNILAFRYDPDWQIHRKVSKLRPSFRVHAQKYCLVDHPSLAPQGIFQILNIPCWIRKVQELRRSYVTCWRRLLGREHISPPYPVQVEATGHVRHAT